MQNRSQPTPAGKEPLDRSLPIVLTFGLAEPIPVSISSAFRVVHSEDVSEAFRLLEEEAISVLVLGSHLSPMPAADFLSECTSRLARIPATIVLCAGFEAELFQRSVDEGRLFYLARSELKAEQFFRLVKAAAGWLDAQERPDESLFKNQIASDHWLDLCVRLPMQTDLQSCGSLIVQTLQEVLDVSAARCMVYESTEDTLTPTGTGESQTNYSAASGLTAFVARTGEGVRVECIDGDPRYDSDIDNLENKVNGRFAAEPIFGPDSLPVGVIAAVRGGDSPPFSARDSRIIKQLAECAAPTFGQLLLQLRVQAQLTERTTGADGSSNIFRQEALDYHMQSWDRQGEVLKSLPAWLRMSYWVVLAMVLVGMVGLGLLIPGLRDIFARGH